MRYLIVGLLAVALASCAPKEEEPFGIIDKLYKDYELQPNAERAEVYLDSLRVFIAEHGSEKELIKPYLQQGVQVGIEQGQLSVVPGFLLPLLRYYPELENRKDYALRLGDVLYALRKPHAASVVYKDLIQAYPSDNAVIAKQDLIDSLALAQEDYLTYLFDQLLVNPDEYGINKAAALKYVDAVEAKALISPADPAVPGHLYGAAEVARSMRTFPKAMSLYDWIIEDYPDNEKTPNVLFIKGFILEQDYKLENEAKAAYELFLEKYPDHQMAESAQFLLNNLGKSDQQILEEIEKRRSAG